jgi:hypothetical protein
MSAKRAAAAVEAETDSQLAQAAQEVVSDDPMTVAGMNYLVSSGLLTEARRDEILNG